MIACCFFWGSVFFIAASVIVPTGNALLCLLGDLPPHTQEKEKKKRKRKKKKSRGCQRPWRRWPTLHVTSFLYSFSCHWFYCWSSSVTSSRRPITWIRRCTSLKRDPRIVSLDILLLSTGLTRQVAPPKMCKFISFLFWSLLLLLF